jgi:hypothetical protein
MESDEKKFEKVDQKKEKKDIDIFFFRMSEYVKLDANSREYLRTLNRKQRMKLLRDAIKFHKKGFKK